MTIIVDGNVGVGKTDFMRNIQKKLSSLNVDSEIVLEPVETWNMEQLLENAGKFPSAFMFQLQTLVMTTLFQRFGTPSKTSPRVTIFERSLESSFEVFTKLHDQEKNLTQSEGRILHGLYLTFQKIKKIPKPDIHFYLRCPPEECYLRTQKRNQDGDKGVSLEYLKKLDAQYEKYYSECLMKNKNLIVFDSNNLDSEKLAEEAARFICLKLNM